jgi:type IV secretory pathway VirD2 relaxase
MKSKRSDLELRYILLFKLDAKNLYHRITSRRHEYVEIFSLKRNRAIFKDVFEHRYSKASIQDLSHCSIEIIESLDSFYQAVDEIYWYLKHTQDMPNTIEDEIHRRINALKRQYEMLTLYIDAELTGSEQTEIQSF